MGCSQGRVQRWENATNRISAVDFVRVCRLYEVEPGKMLANLESA
jgi:hypothetical protein